MASKIQPSGKVTCFEYDTLGSTNDEALRLLTEETPPIFVSAKNQTAGRGRMGRQWHSPEGNLYCTAAFKAEVPLKELPTFTLYAGLRLAEAIAKKTRVRVWLKWPNDLWVGQKKCAGLLAEAPVVSGVGRVLILGVGLNVNSIKFPAGLRATSLRLEAHKTFDLERLRSLLCSSLAESFERFCAGIYLEEMIELWLCYDGLTGKNICFENKEGVRRGKVLGIDADGALCVKTGKEVVSLRSGEVTLSKFLRKHD